MTRTPSSTDTPQGQPERYAKCKRGFTCNDCSHFGMCDAEPPCSRPITPAPDLSHIREDRRGCLTCIDPGCPVWQTADQNCWKSQNDYDAALIQPLEEANRSLAAENIWLVQERDALVQRTLDTLWHRMSAYFDGDPAVESLYVNVADLATEIESLRSQPPTTGSTATDHDSTVIRDFIREFVNRVNEVHDSREKMISLDSIAGVLYDLKTRHGISHEDDIGGSYTIYLRKPLGKPAVSTTSPAKGNDDDRRRFIQFADSQFKLPAKGNDNLIDGDRRLNRAMKEKFADPAKGKGGE